MNPTERIEEALGALSVDATQPKGPIVDALLDVRLSTADPAVVEAVDAELASMPPQLLVTEDARAALERVAAIAAASPEAVRS